MIVNIIKSNNNYEYKFNDVFSLENDFKLNNFTKKNKCKSIDKIKITLDNDNKDEILHLLIILSPIFITIFDNSLNLEFFRKNLEISNFSYGLYPNFFEGFDKEKYFEFYEKHTKNEDIILRKDKKIEFTINYIEDKYILSLISLMEVLFEINNRKNLISYFKEIRNDIVINGRRSILANDIYAFYLSKYLVSWALDLIKIARYKDYKRYRLIEPIYNLTNNLKRPILKNYI